MKAHSGVILASSPVYRHGDILVAIVGLAIDDIRLWMDRRDRVFRTAKAVTETSLLDDLRNLRRNAQQADRWIRGLHESTISYQECCELLDVDHSTAVEAIYHRWTAEQIEELRSASIKTDAEDVAAMLPNRPKSLIPIEDIEIPELTDAGGGDGGEFGETFSVMEGDQNARIKPKSETGNHFRHRKLRPATGQGAFTWGDDSMPAAGHQGDKSEAELCGIGD